MFTREVAVRAPERAAIIMGMSGESISYRALEDQSNRLAQAYRAAGLRPGNHIALLMENQIEMIVAQAAAERSGLYFTCVNHHLSADEAAYIVDDCTARLVMSTEGLRDLAVQLPERCPRVERWVQIDGVEPPEGFERFEDFVVGAPSEPIADEEMGAVMYYSSGTTGRPKGIVRPRPTHPVEETPPAIALLHRLWEVDEACRYLCPAPLYHAAPQASIAMSLRAGATVVVMERFDAATYLELVERHGITHSQVVPTMFSRLLKLPDEIRERADVSSLRTVVHAAAPCPVPVKRAMIDWFGPIIVEYYASSEAVGFTHCTSAEWLAHPGTVGAPMGGEIVILDEHLQPCPAGVDGTVYFKGQVDFEYFNDPDKTASVFDPTGTATTVGDIGHLDEDGYLYLTDRATFMIISGGANIYPQETENLLMTHPDVDDVAVIGVPDEDLGEVVKAVVIAAPHAVAGAELESTLVAFCRDNLAHYKCPRSVDFVDELPRLPTGKLAKHKLRAHYWDTADGRRI